MSMIIGTIATVCIQAYTAYSNYTNNKENAEEIKKIQHEYKQQKQEKSIERDKEKFRRSCELQLLMEENEHKYKMDNAHQKFLDSIDSLIHKQELRDFYPLVISPQIISNSILPTNLDEIGYAREYILCVLTNSNNELFNKYISPVLDNYLCSCFSKYWNKSSQHQVCYYTNVWKKDKRLSYDASDWNNLRPLISSPTVFITPLVDSSNNVSIRITFMVNGKEFHCDRNVNIKFCIDPLVENYQKQIKEFKSKFIELAFTNILCDAAFIIDSHYWRNHKLPPRLPRLLASNLIQINPSEKKEYIQGYETFFRCSVLGAFDETTINFVAPDSKEKMEFIASINQFNFPLRCISYLESILELSIGTKRAEMLFEDTLISFCGARIVMKSKSVEDIEVSQLDKDDMEVIAKLADLSKKHRLKTDYISNIIRKWIYNW